MTISKRQGVLAEALAGKFNYAFLGHFLDAAAGGEYFTSLNLHLAGVLGLKQVRCEPPVYGNGPRITFQPLRGRREVFNPMAIPEQWKEIALFALVNNLDMDTEGRNERLVPLIVMEAVAKATGWKWGD